MKQTTENHEALRGLFATAELLVTVVRTYKFVPHDGSRKGAVEEERERVEKMSSHR